MGSGEESVGRSGSSPCGTGMSSGSSRPLVVTSGGAEYERRLSYRIWTAHVPGVVRAQKISGCCWRIPRDTSQDDPNTKHVFSTRSGQKAGSRERKGHWWVSPQDQVMWMRLPVSAQAPGLTTSAPHPTPPPDSLRYTVTSFWGPSGRGDPGRSAC